jgi:hypoxanthine-guanine phosphoribosyltransferase
MEQLYSQTKIKRKVLQLAEAVEKQAKAALHVHVIMDGGFMFGADFVRVYAAKISKVTFLHIVRGYSAGHVHPPRLLFKWPRYTRDLNPTYTHLILDVCVEQGVTLAFAEGYIRGSMLEKTQIIKCVLVANSTTGLAECDHVGFIQKGPYFLTGYGMGPYRDFGAIYGVPK